MLKRGLFFCLMLVWLAAFSACNEGSGSSADDSAEAAVSEDDDGLDLSSLTFAASSFSALIEFTDDTAYLRMLFDFFPDGTDFDFTAKTATVPCIDSDVPEGVDASISAPEDGESCEDTVLTFAEAADFDEEGIIVPLAETGYDGLSGDYQLLITTSGIYDTGDDAVLLSEEGDLTAYYEMILAKS